MLLVFMMVIMMLMPVNILIFKFITLLAALMLSRHLQFCTVLQGQLLAQHDRVLLILDDFVVSHADNLLRLHHINSVTWIFSPYMFAKRAQIVWLFFLIHQLEGLEIRLVLNTDFLGFIHHAKKNLVVIG
jgi:hypothetical protein